MIIRLLKKEWKIQITMRVNFSYSKDTGETRTIYVLSDTEDIMKGGWGGGGGGGEGKKKFY